VPAHPARTGQRSRLHVCPRPRRPSPRRAARRSRDDTRQRGTRHGPRFDPAEVWRDRGESRRDRAPPRPGPRAGIPDPPLGRPARAARAGVSPAPSSRRGPAGHASSRAVAAGSAAACRHRIGTSRYSESRRDRSVQCRCARPPQQFARAIDRFRTQDPAQRWSRAASLTRGLRTRARPAWRARPQELGSRFSACIRTSFIVARLVG